MIWLSRLVTAVEILLLVKAIQRRRKATRSSTPKDVSPDAFTSETTEHTSSTNSQPTHQRPLFGEHID